jgi:hypothetical protein
MKQAKNHKNINPFDLHSVAQNTKFTGVKNIASLRSHDIYSAGGKNSSSRANEVKKGKQ